jgi:hypothetical protein
LALLLRQQYEFPQCGINKENIFFFSCEGSDTYPGENRSVNSLNFPWNSME